MVAEKERQRGLRIDALPDGYNWQDRGCSVAPRCLDCPLEVCRYDLPAGQRSMVRNARALAVAEALRSGKSPDEIAMSLGISRRSVFRLQSGR